MYRIDKSCLRTAFWGCGGCQWSHERFVHAASYTVHQSDTTTVSDCALLALSYLAPTRCGPKSSRPAPAPGAAEAAAAATNCAAGCAEVPLPNAGLARQTTAGELALPPTTAV